MKVKLQFNHTWDVNIPNYSVINLKKKNRRKPRTQDTKKKNSMWKVRIFEFCNIDKFWASITSSTAVK